MLTVGIASSDTVSSAQLVATLEQTGVVKSIKEWMIPGARIPDTADALPDVVLLDLGRDAESFFAFGAQLRRIRPATRLIAVSAISPPTHQLLLEAMRGGVQDVLPKPVAMDVLKEMLGRLAEELGVHERPSLDKLIVVMGSKGGVGATTVAVNLGVQLSVFARKRVALLDFARPLGNAHLLLDMRPQFNVRDAVDNLERLDGHFFAGLLTSHHTKLQVLAGATQPEEWQTIAVPPLERVVNVAQNGFDAVLLDMGQVAASYVQSGNLHFPNVYLVDGNGMIRGHWEEGPLAKDIFEGNGLTKEVDKVLGVPAPAEGAPAGGNFRSAQTMIASRAITPTRCMSTPPACRSIRAISCRG